MTPAANIQTIAIWAGAAGLIAWRMHARIRRMVGRQKFSNVRPWFTVVLFPLILASMVPASLGNQANLEALVGGALAGIVLGVFGLRLTKFEQTPEGLFYTPNAHLGIALSVILICRVGYRLVTSSMYGVTGTAGAMPGTVALTPLTLVIFATLAGYYVTYAIGLLRWHHNSK